MNSQPEKEKGRPLDCSGCAEIPDEEKIYIGGEVGWGGAADG